MTDAEARDLKRGDPIKLRMQASWGGHYPQRWRFVVDRVIDLGGEVYVETMDGARLIAWEVERYRAARRAGGIPPAPLLGTGVGSGAGRSAGGMTGV